KHHFHSVLFDNKTHTPFGNMSFIKATARLYVIDTKSINHKSGMPIPRKILFRSLVAATRYDYG
ncbi:MAG: hypothetical protein D6677_03630, partial [Calditrichaeota bacterium]